MAQRIDAPWSRGYAAPTMLSRDLLRTDADFVRGRLHGPRLRPGRLRPLAKARPRTPHRPGRDRRSRSAAATTPARPSAKSRKKAATPPPRSPRSPPSKARIEELEQRLERIDGELAYEEMRLPNLPDTSVPEGRDEAANVEVRRVGEPRQIRASRRRPTGISAPDLGILDFERGAKLSGARFTVSFGAGARARKGARRLHARPAHRSARLHRGVRRPYLVSRHILEGTGQPAQIRKRPLPDRSPGPLPDPHRRGAGNQPAPRRDPRRSRPCPSATPPTPPASAPKPAPTAATCAA